MLRKGRNWDTNSGDKHKLKHKKNGNQEQQKIAKKAKLNFPHEFEGSIYNNFRQGDMVFGLKKPLWRIIDKLAQHGFTYTYARSLNAGMVGQVVNNVNISDEDFCKLEFEKQEHYLFLMTYKGYLLREPGKSTASLKDNDPKLGAAIRRACKLLANPDKFKSHRAHIELDGINWEFVCNKNKTGLGVTNSELRSIYRDFANKGPNPNVFFYNKNVKCKPPWEQDEIKSHWDAYEEQRKQKLLKK